MASRPMSVRVQNYVFVIFPSAPSLTPSSLRNNNFSRKQQNSIVVQMSVSTTTALGLNHKHLKLGFKLKWSHHLQVFRKPSHLNYWVIPVFYASGSFIRVQRWRGKERLQDSFLDCCQANRAYFVCLTCWKLFCEKLNKWRENKGGWVGRGRKQETYRNFKLFIPDESLQQSFHQHIYP